MPRDCVGRDRTWGEWFRHKLRGCVPFIKEDGEVINGLWWGFCDYCGSRHAREVVGRKPVGPWSLR